ncbi:MAG: hypothetical protein ABW116_01510 [Candidatus Sedimenticola sp. 20ELBAFRAG]
MKIKIKGLALLVGAVLLTVLVSGCNADSTDPEVLVSNTSHLPGKKIGGIHYFPACLPVGTFCMEQTVPEDSTVEIYLGEGTLEWFYKYNKIPRNAGITLETIVPRGQYMAKM